MLYHRHHVSTTVVSAPIMNTNMMDWHMMDWHHRHGSVITG
jgi:hypothetical protein